VDDVDALYGLPLDEFTPARNELAKQLRKEGDKERADEVKALAKPSVAAWAVNQLARRRGARVKKLLEAGEALRKAQEKALEGGGADALRKATQAERDLVMELRREARELLAESGRPAPDSMLERIGSTLSNAAVDPEARELLEAGRLVEEVESSGFDAFAGMALPAGGAAPPKRKAEPKPKAAPKARPSGAEEKERAAAERKRAAELRRRAHELERVARAAEREAQRAARDAERAAQAAERAAEEAAAAQEEADTARAAADAAQAEVASLNGG
jgi:hypothetical protein